MCFLSFFFHRHQYLPNHQFRVVLPCSWFSAETSTVARRAFFSHGHNATLQCSGLWTVWNSANTASPAWQHCVTKHFQTENENAYLPAMINIARRRCGVSLTFWRRDTSVNIQAYTCNYLPTHFLYLLVGCLFNSELVNVLLLLAYQCKKQCSDRRSRPTHDIPAGKQKRLR